MVEEQRKWYQKTSFVVVAFLCVGPFALPLLWFNPHYKSRSKVIVTIIVVILSYYLTIWTIEAVKSISSYYQMMLQGGL